MSQTEHKPAIHLDWDDTFRAVKMRMTRNALEHTGHVTPPGFAEVAKLAMGEWGEVIEVRAAEALEEGGGDPFEGLPPEVFERLEEFHGALDEFVRQTILATLEVAELASANGTAWFGDDPDEDDWSEPRGENPLP